MEKRFFCKVYFKSLPKLSTKIKAYPALCVGQFSFLFFFLFSVSICCQADQASHESEEISRVGYASFLYEQVPRDQNELQNRSVTTDQC